MKKQLIFASKRRSTQKFLGALLLAIFAGVIVSALEHGVLSRALRPSSTIRVSLTCENIPFLNGKTIMEAYSVVLEVKNAGESPIERQNYEQPLSLILINGTKVLAAQSLEAQPEILRPSYETGVWKNNMFVPDSNGNVIQFQPLLLNENDFFRYRVILDKPSPPLKLLGHIAGVKLSIVNDNSCG